MSISSKTVFASKVNPSIVTRLNNEEDGEVEAGSMMVDELYFMQFSNDVKSWSFIELSMKTQILLFSDNRFCSQIIVFVLRQS